MNHSNNELNSSEQLYSEPRAGCKDLWNAFMVEDAVFSGNDIPLCPTFIPCGLPKAVISYSKAKALFKKQQEQGNKSFHIEAFIHFCEDDQGFDGPREGIWTKYNKAYDIACHFDGIITPDFSTYADFPDPIKRYNTYRMRAFGYWCYTNKISVINNVRWGTSETWSYCFDGIEKNSVVFIGTVASGLNRLINRNDFEVGLYKMVEILHPHTIIIYGSSNYKFFDKLKDQGIKLIVFPSETNQAYRGGKDNE